ncbi:hypothetical protein MRB53_010377 [Persea americana]|uniref:Uncharacterized protein n=1 Tax=Persea americana TaxID=3435 RepID=A0ACC2LS02_PERAE|nr:hypothetical protein MRB53_010377 [Persea americana]
MDSGGFHAAASSLRQTPTEPKIAPAVRRRNGGSDFATELILCCPRFCSDFATEPSSSKQIVLCCFRFCNRTDPTSYSAVSASSPVTRNGSGEEFRQVFFTARWRGVPKLYKLPGELGAHGSKSKFDTIDLKRTAAR